LSLSQVLPALESVATHHCTYCSPNGETEMKKVVTQVEEFGICY
jgi:hypothetical protein